MSDTPTRHRWLIAALLALGLTLGIPALTARAEDGTVTPTEARKAALAWLNVSPYFAATAYTPAPSVLEIQDAQQKRTLAYVLKLQPRGFVVVTAHRELNPIIAYSENSVFDASETHQNILLDLLRGDISERLRALDSGDIRSSYRDRARSRWESYLEMVDEHGRMRTEGGPVRLLESYDVEHGPFLTSEWGQSTDGAGNAAFNYYTPPGPDGAPGNFVCGCVATAFGQLLNYYEWPEIGTGSHGYAWTTETLSADFGATDYDWNNVLDIYGDGGKTITQTRAVGTVTYHAGVALEMNYGPGGSSASTRDVAGALQEHFRATGDWSSGTESDFDDRLYANMLNHRPGQLSIHDTKPPLTAGHSVVVDGVRHNNGDTRYYHLNMGWEGTHDAWYDIASDFTTGSYTWDTVNGAVLDVVPTPNLNDPGTTSTGAALPISWDVASLQEASKYELQQATVSSSLGSLSDDAESGTGNWRIDGHWEPSSVTAHSPSYSFHGDLYDGSIWEYPGTLTLERAAKVDASTNIAYWWRLMLFDNYEARFQIADVGPNEKNWTTLRTYTSSGNTGWALETVTTSDLSAYAGHVVSLRFVIDYLGGSISYGGAGYYLDDFTINDGYIGSNWTTVDDDITAELRAVPVSESGEYCYRVRAYGCDPSIQPSCSGQWWDWSDVESVTLVSDAYVSAATGSWSEGSTWEGGGVPPAGSSAIIRNGHTVTVNSNRKCNDVVIDSGGSLVVANGVNLSISGDWVNDGSLTPNDSTAIFDGSSAQAVGGDSTFHNLTITNTHESDKVNASGSTLAVSGLLHVQDGVFRGGSDYQDVQIDSGGTLELDGDSTVDGNWINNGTFIHNNHDVTFDGSSAQIVGGSSATVFDNLTVSSGTAVVIGTMPLAGTLTNNGTLQQTQDVSGSSDVSFVDTGDYGGVILNANGLGLGSTLVTIRGNNANCTAVTNETLKRCFDIAPANPSGRDATITFYFNSSELSGTGSTCDTLNPYHWNGSSWELLTLDTSYDEDGRLCGSDPQSIRVIHVTDFSSFVSKSGGPPQGGVPTAVRLADFDAAPQRLGAGTPGSAYGFAVPAAVCLLGLIWAVLRRVRRRTVEDSQ